ncbi:MAG TPA: N-6 DNA methylase, partial [Candidatus Acidoferrales bacterium]|nr:N-6 DNA methylase [Candidatus Acidoferrales bacterium]
KENGRMGIVVPDGVLTNSSLQYVRDFIMRRAQVLAVVSLPHTAFTQFGAGVKASLLFLRKKAAGEKLARSYAIFMAIANHIGYDATGRPDENELLNEGQRENGRQTNTSPEPETPRILDLWLAFTESKPAERLLCESPLVFQVRSDELEGRLDCQFYHPDYTALEKKIRHSKFEVSPLGDLASRIVDGPFGSQLKVEEYQTSGVPLVRVGDVANGEIVPTNLVYITQEKQAQLNRSQVLPGDVLLTKAGSLGYSAVFPSIFKQGNITSHLVAIRCKKDLLPGYLALYMRSPLGKTQLYRWGNKTTRPELNTEEVKKVLVVKPPLDVQRDLVARYEDKKLQARKLKDQSRQLLESAQQDAVASLMGDPSSRADSQTHKCS